MNEILLICFIILLVTSTFILFFILCKKLAKYTKYSNISKSTTGGNNNFKDITGEEYLTRIKNTDFVDNNDIVFNIFAVLKGARTAYLFESVKNRFEDNYKVYNVQDVLNVFPELEFDGLLVYRKENKHLIDHSDNEKLGNLLGFEFSKWYEEREITNDRSENTITLTQFVDNINFKIEVGPDTEKERALNKLKADENIFKPLAEELGMKYSNSITHNLSHDFFRNIVINKDIDNLKKYKEQFIEFLYGSGLQYMAELLTSNFDYYINEGYNSLLFSVLQDKHALYHDMFPIDPTTKIENYLNEIDVQILHSKDPVKMLNYIREFTCSKEFSKKYEKLVNEYYNILSNYSK